MVESHAIVPEGPRFVAIGGVWLDEIKKEGKTLHKDVLGGSVTYGKKIPDKQKKFVQETIKHILWRDFDIVSSGRRRIILALTKAATLGARLFTPGKPGSVHMLIITGEDYPAQALGTLQAWQISLSVLTRNGAVAARGIAHYGRDESERHYERLTAPLNTSLDDLDQSELLYARSFHFFDVPAMISRATRRILEARQYVGHQLPLTIWEPQAKSCSTKTLADHLSAAIGVDVFSPNHVELASFFNQKQDVVFSQGSVEKHASVFVENGIGAGEGCAVIRCAEHGAVVMSRTIPPTWLPAYYDTTSGKVINSTGAGNAFLGSFAVGYQVTGSYIEAAKYGAVGASFVVEQVGLPKLTGVGTSELWNGDSVQDRLKLYSSSLQERVENQGYP